ncbi:MAG: DUF1634 domain-containing protein [Ktedonobacterales bacterium]
MVPQAEVMISRVLRAGVLVSAGIICLGLIEFLFSPRSQARAQHVPVSFSAIWIGILHADPLAIILLGLVVLLATPVLRVAVSIVSFAMDHDRLYVGVTALVLAILMLSFLSGLGGG